MLISKAMTVKDSGEELQMRAIELDGEGWIQIAQDKSRGMYSRSGAERDQPRHFQGCRAGYQAHGAASSGTLETLQPKAPPVTMVLETWLQPYRQELKQGKEGCCEQAGVCTCVVMLAVKI